jgi:hypothetical protein
MKKYLVIYHAPAAAMEKMTDATPEQMKAGMEPWMQWAERCGEGLVDLGTPLGAGCKITAAGSSPSDRDVVGYSIVQADSAEAAHALLQGHPHLVWEEGCEIEVHECQVLPA